MCGLVGVAGDIGNSDRKMFNTLLLLDVVRGKDSTGVVVNSLKDGVDPVIAKGLGTPCESVFKQKTYIKAAEDKVNLLLGHNRWATVGLINKDNAHPFKVGKILGAHNGTIRNVKLLHEGASFAVDSLAVFNHLEKFGVGDAVSKIDGAFALTWLNTEDNTMNFIRNKERPLFYSFSRSGKSLYWASEKWMLEVGSKYAKVFLDGIHEVLPFHHYAFTLPKEKGGFNQKFDLVDITKVEPFKRPVVRYNQSTNNFGNHLKGGVTPRPKSQGVRHTNLQRFNGSEIEFYLTSTSATKGGTPFHFKGSIAGNPSIEVRVCALPNSDQYEHIRHNLSKKFTGTVKKVKNGSEQYLLIKVPSIDVAKELLPVIPKHSNIHSQKGSYHSGYDDEGEERNLWEWYDSNMECISEYDDDPYPKGHPHTGTGDSPIDDMYPVMGDLLVTGMDFCRLTQDGCSGCGDPIHLEEADEIQWEDTHVMFCKSCNDNGMLDKYRRNEL